jgi:hypothetical protein
MSFTLDTSRLIDTFRLMPTDDLAGTFRDLQLHFSNAGLAQDLEVHFLELHLTLAGVDKTASS